MLSSKNRLSTPFKLFIYFAFIFSALTALGGCNTGNRPRSRMGSFFGSPGGMSFPNPEKLGPHRFKFSMNEKIGMVYTCRAGFIDLGHLREAADRTAYLTSVTYDNLMQENNEFNYKIIEPSRYWVKIKYPQYWQQISADEKQSIAKQVSIKFGQYCAHRSMIWHEIVTWYGFSSVGIFPENISSFSWEDTYSDNLGTWLATKALQHERDKFDETMTMLIDKTLTDLDVQSPKVAKQAVKEIAGQWYTGAMYFFVTMKKQNFDVGFDDGMITPFLVPGICPNATPKAYPISNLQAVANLGFEIELEIEPLVMQGPRINKSIDSKNDRLTPDEHFPQIIEQIKANLDESMALYYGDKYPALRIQVVNE